MPQEGKPRGRKRKAGGSGGSGSPSESGSGSGGAEDREPAAEEEEEEEEEGSSGSEEGGGSGHGRGGKADGYIPQASAAAAVAAMLCRPAGRCCCGCSASLRGSTGSGVPVTALPHTKPACLVPPCLQATSYAIQQPRETVDQPPFDCSTGCA